VAIKVDLWLLVTDLQCNPVDGLLGIMRVLFRFASHAVCWQNLFSVNKVNSDEHIRNSVFYYTDMRHLQNLDDATPRSKQFSMSNLVWKLMRRFEKNY